MQDNVDTSCRYRNTPKAYSLKETKGKERKGRVFI